MATTDFVNIASYLPALAAEKPDVMAVACPCGRDDSGKIKYTEYTLKQLNEQSDVIAHGLASLGIRWGTRAVLMAKPGFEFFALTFAMFKMGAIPVMIDPGIGIKNLKTCIGEAEPDAFIGIPKAQIARILLGWGKKTIKTVVTVGKKFFWGGKTLDEVISAGKKEPYNMAKTRAGDVAAILFTSGNTGISKGAIYTHGIFDAQVKSIQSVYGIEPGERDLSTFPLFALFGPAMGMSSIIPEMDASMPITADPVLLIQAALDFETTNMFASPALIEKLGRYGEEHGVKLPSLKRVISAGAPARIDALERFSKMLSPGVEIFTPYGATEALPVCNVGSNEILKETRHLTDQGKGICVGLPVPGMTVEIIKITDDPLRTWSDDMVLPAGEIGEIAVKSPVVTRQYYNRQDATVLAKIIDTRDGGLYHRMGDVGYRDDKGRIWFCGRKSHMVETPDGTLFTIPCEGVFNVHPKVLRTALVGVKKDGATIPVLCVQLEKGVPGGENEKKKIREELLALGASKPHTDSIKTILFHPSFPVDVRHNAKIHREKLQEWVGRTVR